MHLNRVNFSINCLTDDSRPPFRFELKLPEESVNILARQCFSLRGQRFLSDFYHSLEHTNFQYMLKQWIMLKARSDWLVKFQISFAIYLRAIREEMASRFASVSSEEIIQINFCGVYYLTVLVHTKTTI